MSGNYVHASEAKKRKAPADVKPFDLDSVEPNELLEMVKKAGGQRAFVRKFKVKRTSLQNRLYKIKRDPFTHRPAPQAREVAVAGQRQRFILTSAQDTTKVHGPFLDNLEAYRDWLAKDGPCEIMIGGFTYSKKLFEDHAPTASYFEERLIPYLVTDRVRIGDAIDFCGEMNTLPTAVRPLSGLSTYTRKRWGIFPHAKVQLESVPTMMGTPAKMNMTTGAVTMPNYLPMKAGIKASFHHILGAVLVEIEADGTFFCRHLIADQTGTFYDLDRRVEDATVTTGHRATSLTPGDVHVAQMDHDNGLTVFGVAPTTRKADVPGGGRVWESIPIENTLVGLVNPEYLFIHDVSDFRARNHHEIGDAHGRFRHFIEGTESVEEELREVAGFLDVIDNRSPDTKIVVVESNHDLALEKWLKTADYRTDPVNARFFLRCQLACYDAMAERRKGFSIFREVMQKAFGEGRCAQVEFLNQRSTYEVGGVEHANHGHNGPNGARGSVAGFAKVGPKITHGHTHSAAIHDGVYCAGTSSKLDLGYNVGPSSWSHSHVLQYQNGARVMITVQNGCAFLPVNQSEAPSNDDDLPKDAAPVAA